MFSLRPRTNDMENLVLLTGDVMEPFQVVSDTLIQPNTQSVMVDGGHYTDTQVNTMLKAAHKNVVDQFTMAFLVNFLAPNL